MFRRMGGGGGAGGGASIFNIGRSKAQLFDKDTKVNKTFKDVAGLQEAKLEVMEIVDFLQNPKKYTNLGGKIPKGVLFLALQVRVKHCWPKQLPVRLAFLSSLCQVLIS